MTAKTVLLAVAVVQFAPVLAAAPGGRLAEMVARLKSKDRAEHGAAWWESP